MAHTTKENRDVYYRMAKEDGYRARSAYKLVQIFQAYGIFYPMLTIERAKYNLENSKYHIYNAVDLCSAPGSWSQCLRNFLYHEYNIYKSLNTFDKKEHYIKKPTIIAIDLQEMAPVKGVVCIKGDITNPQVLDKVKTIFHENAGKDELAQLIVCDGAPDVTGLHETDAIVQSTIICAALYVSCIILQSGGILICKAFSSEINTPVYRRIAMHFEDFSIYKPAASRASSAECFLVARGFRPNCQLSEPIYRSISIGDLSCYDKDIVN